MSLSPAYTDVWSESDWSTSNGEAWDYLVSGLFNDAGGYYYGTSNYGDYGSRVQALFDLIDYYEAGNLTFDSLLEAIEGSGFLNEDQGLADVIRDRLMTVDTFYDYAEYNQYSDEFGQAAATGDAEVIQDFIDTWSDSGIGDNTFAATSGGPGMPPTPAGLPTWTTGMAEDVISMLCQGSPICAGVDICFEQGQEDCINPFDVRDLWEDVVSHVYIVFGDLGIPIPDLPIPLPGILKLPTLGNIWEKIQNTVGGIANSEENCLENVPAGEDPETYCSTTNRITRAIQEGSEEVVTKAGEVLEDVLDTAVGAVTDPVETAEKIWDWIKGAYGDDPTKAPDWVWGVIIGSEIYGQPDVRDAIEDVVGVDIDDDGTVGTPNEVPFGPDNPNPDCVAQGLETNEQGECVSKETPVDCSSLNRTGGFVSDELECGECLQGYEEAVGANGETVCQPEDDPFENEGPTAEDCNALHKEHIPSDGVSDSYCGECLEGYKSEGDNCVPVTEDPEPEGCESVDCSSPRPEGNTFEGQTAYRLWEQCCGETHCPDGSEKVPDYDCNGNYTGETCEDKGLIEDPNDGSCLTQEQFCARYPDDESCVVDPETPQEGDPCDSTGDGVNDGTIVNGECVATPEEECVKPDGTPTGATPSSGCNQCPDGYTFDFEGICQPDGGTINCAEYNRETLDDGTCGGCLPGFAKDTSLPNEPCVKIFDGCPAGYELVNGECVPVTCPEGQSYCKDTDQCEPNGTCPSDEEGDDGSSSGGGGGGGGGRGFDINPIQVNADPQLLGRKKFGAQDFLTPLFAEVRTGGGTDFPIARFLQGQRNKDNFS